MMKTSEDGLAASLGRLAERVPVPSDAWSENQRRVAGRRSAHRRRWVVPAVAAAVVAVLVTASVLLSTRPDRSTAGPVITTDLLVPTDQRLPVAALSGPDVVTGTVRALDAFRGRPLVVTVWGSWCAPCRGQQPDLNRAATALDDTGVPLLGLNVLDDRVVAQRYLDDLAVNYPSMTATPQEVAAAIPGVPAGSTPVVVFLDREHRVAQILERPVTADEVVAAATALAAE